jgi:hypothetical protein
MGTTLARGSVLTISGFLADLRVSVFVVSATVAAATASAGLKLVSDEGVGLVVTGTVSFTSVLFFLGNLGFAMMEYSLHPPKFRNDWIC